VAKQPARKTAVIALGKPSALPHLHRLGKKTFWKRIPEPLLTVNRKNILRDLTFEVG
jgi:hypothetical protein